MTNPEPKPRWFRLSPDRFVAGLFLAICLLWLSEQFQWFGFNHHKGWTVLIATAVIGLAALVMLLWWIAGLIFGWRFQFGIRSLLMLCLACSIAVGWMAAEMRRAERQAAVIEWINGSNGAIAYDWQVDPIGLPLLQRSEPPGSGWLRNVLGVDFFSRVFQVYLIEAKVTDAGLETLKDLGTVQDLILIGPAITDAELVHIKGLTTLRSLNLEETHVTDAGLENLIGMRQLWSLSLEGTKVTDAGLEQLLGLTTLKALDLTATAVTDAGLEHLKGLSSLVHLRMLGTNVTVAGVKNLQQELPNCTIAH